MAPRQLLCFRSRQKNSSTIKETIRIPAAAVPFFHNSREFIVGALKSAEKCNFWDYTYITIFIYTSKAKIIIDLNKPFKIIWCGILWNEEKNYKKNISFNL